MDARIIYLLVFALLFAAAFWLQKKFDIISDNSAATPKSYSYARLQLLWWTFIIFATFISIVTATGEVPDFDSSILILLGIGSATTAVARMTDISDETQQKAAVANAINTAQATGTAPVMPAPLNKDQPSEGFWLDILSDRNGISIHRLQALVFNLVFGLWFIYQSVLRLKGVDGGTSDSQLDSIMPVLSNNNLILLGLSAGTYAALKTTENK